MPHTLLLNTVASATRNGVVARLARNGCARWTGLEIHPVAACVAVLEKKVQNRPTRCGLALPVTAGDGLGFNSTSKSFVVRLACVIRLDTRVRYRACLGAHRVAQVERDAHLVLTLTAGGTHGPRCDFPVKAVALA